MRRQAFAVGPVGAAGRPLFSCAAGRSPLRPVTRRAFVVRCLQGSGRTALIEAARLGKKEVVQLLIEAGANREAQSNNRSTALIGAARSGEKEVVQLLIEAGANQEARDNDGKTAIDWAREQNKPEVVRLLEVRG